MNKRIKSVAETLGILGLVVGFAAGFAAMSSQFAAAADTGFYLGGNAGWSKADIDRDGIRDGLRAEGLTTTSFKDDDSEFGHKLFGGYQFTRHFALEGGYFDLGDFSFKAETIPPGTLEGNLEIRGYNLDLVGILPVTERLSAFARVGANYAKTDGTFTGTGLVIVPEPRTRERDTNLKFGFGLQHDFTKSLSLRTEAERYRINDTVGDDGDIDLFSLGLVYRPGAKTVATRPAVHRPEPVAREPALVIVPIVPRREQYCSILDIQFEINMDEIRQDDQEKLGVLGTFMNKYNDTHALIEGHTDNVGSAEDNMRLSQRRAESVVAYLINNFNISSSRLKAVGYGETRPIADNRTDLGKRQNRRINAVIGCASDVEGLTVDPARVTMALEMEFDTNKSDVRPQYREDLRRVANFIKAKPGLIVTVEGHTSNQQGGAPSQDMQLSQRRAESVVDYLVREFGVDRSRLFAAGFGHTRRTAYNTSAEGQQENRRVNIIFEFPDR